MIKKDLFGNRHFLISLWLIFMSLQHFLMS